jgi:hypothetical protein
MQETLGKSGFLRRLWVEKGSKDGDADADWFEAKKLLGLN